MSFFSRKARERETSIDFYKQTLTELSSLESLRSCYGMVHLQFVLQICVIFSSFLINHFPIHTYRPCPSIDSNLYGHTLLKFVQTAPKCFGSDQKQLNFTFFKPCPKRLILVQNNFDMSKTIWTGKRTGQKRNVLTAQLHDETNSRLCITFFFCHENNFFFPVHSIHPHDVHLSFICEQKSFGCGWQKTFSEFSRVFSFTNRFFVKSQITLFFDFDLSHKIPLIIWQSTDL